MRLRHLGQNRNCQQAFWGFWSGIHTRVLTTCWEEILLDQVFTKNVINPHAAHPSHGLLKSVIWLITRAIQGQKGPSKMFDVCCVLLFDNPLLGVGQRMINHMSAGSVSLMVVNKILHYAQKQNRRGKRAECRAINIFFQKVAANRKTSIFLPKNVKKNSQHAQLLLRVHLWVHKIFICA